MCTVGGPRRVLAALLGWSGLGLVALSPFMLGFVAFHLYRIEQFLGSLAVACAAVTALSWLLMWTHVRVHVLAMLLTGASASVSAVWISTAGVAVWPDFASSEPGNVKAGYAIGSVLLHVVAVCVAALVLVGFSMHAILSSGLRVWVMWAAYIGTAIGAAIGAPALALGCGVLAAVTTFFVMATVSPLVTL